MMDISALSVTDMTLRVQDNSLSVTNAGGTVTGGTNVTLSNYSSGGGMGW
ncbi:MAG: hypothetical protein IKG86_02800 [Paludibacteraceae bacterium]|nr:hypothetical protein [Paludibacteraceae bacterium]